jgi:hypothetical protein
MSQIGDLWRSKVVEILNSVKDSRTLGYAHRNRIRMHGEEFDLTSNPLDDENGFAIEAIA